MKIVEIWSLKRGALNPPEPLDPEHRAWVEKLWESQDNPVKEEYLGYWKTLRREGVAPVKAEDDFIFL